MNQGEIGKWIFIVGIIIAIFGLLFYFFGNKLGWIGHLPGDISIVRENFSFYFPITSMLLISIVINLVVKAVRYFF